MSNILLSFLQKKVSVICELLVFSQISVLLECQYYKQLNMDLLISMYIYIQNEMFCLSGHEKFFSITGHFAEKCPVNQNFLLDISNFYWTFFSSVFFNWTIKKSQITTKPLESPPQHIGGQSIGLFRGLVPKQASPSDTIFGHSTPGHGTPLKPISDGFLGSENPEKFEEGAFLSPFHPPRTQGYRIENKL